MDSTCWMGTVDHTKLLTQLSIPGTHDSGALYEPVDGTARCQNLAILDQLEVGVRYLDIRCRHVNDDLAVYHGLISQHLTFHAVVTACARFLDAHPTECIIVSLQEEYLPLNNTRTFEETFDTFVATHPGK